MEEKKTQNNLIFSQKDFHYLFTKLQVKVEEKKKVVEALGDPSYSAGVLQGMNFLLKEVDTALVEIWNEKAKKFNSILKEETKNE